MSAALPRPSRPLVVALLVGLLAACATDANRRPTESPDLGSHMHAHFALASQARDSVARGDAGRALGSLSWLGRQSHDADAPATWKPYLERMRVAALAARDADSLEQAARGVSAMAAACGSCHAAMGVQPRLLAPATARADTGEKPQYRYDLRPTMHQHAWAAARLWEGLITPSEAAFSEGLQALRELDVNRALADNLRTHLTRLRTLGGPLVGPLDESTRAELYAHVITECGGCHRVFDVDPGPLAPHASSDLQAK